MDRQTTHTTRKQTRRRRLAAWLGVVVAASTLTSGCHWAQRIPDGPHDTKTSYHDHSAMRIEYPEVNQCMTPVTSAAVSAVQPNTLQDPAELPSLEITLEDAVQQALRSSPVLRTIGGAVVTAPTAATTIYTPGLAHADPLGGVEAALANFDAQYSQSLFWNKVDQPQNIATGGLGAQFTPNTLQATQATFANELSKRTATGAQFALRSNVGYDRNNRPFRQFQSDFVGFLEAEYRQPLMRGSGTMYNRIAGSAGASGAIGQYNGVLIARVNEDVALADFEAAVIQLVSDVEQAYWDLTTAYRLLEATAKGRESALQTFQYQQVRLEVGTGRRDEEAQARSQYYQFEAQVKSALAGEAGLYAREQALRYLIGLPATDGSLLKPTSDPLNAKVVFDWQSALGQALDRRVEVRRQKFTVKRREMELLAARLNRRPQVDFVGQYRWRGLGDNLIGPGDQGPSANLVDSITDGDYQEWTAGIEFLAPIGLRAASSAVAHAKLNLQRERAVLAETELRISHDLSGAARSIDLAFELVETNYSRYMADLRQVEVLRRRYRDGTDNINFLLQAQRQVVTSESEFYRSISDYNLAIRDFHREKGSLLAYNQVNLTEGAWCPGAERDAYELGRFLEPRRHPEKVSAPRPLTSGQFDPAAVQATSGPVSYQAVPVDVVEPGITAQEAMIEEALIEE
ncbi:TolC family protein [Rhodopirellula halodulae]|uniref:TolC family protein n=1 Tax=Rhodopirellula halodulae TaxID=2894198 RepID=UPI001E2FA3D1|nr:TolC family protein [Rhodopirellula sp. JC737]MCC9657152.1 TolC family protein [Rhodopirellula sp. JC737]